MNKNFTKISTVICGIFTVIGLYVLITYLIKNEPVELYRVVITTFITTYLCLETFSGIKHLRE